MPLSNAEMAQEILGELKQVRSELRTAAQERSAIQTKLAVLDQRDEEHKRNVAKFWESTWPELQGKVNDHEGRLVTLERLKFQLVNAEQKIAKLEAQEQALEARLTLLEKRLEHERGQAAYRLKVWAFASAILTAAIAALIVWGVTQ